MLFQIVFDLYPFQEGLYLPAANIVQTDPEGQLTHIAQKALPSTISAYGIALSPDLQHLFDLIAGLQPKALEDKFRPPRARTNTPLERLLAEASVRPTVEGYIHRQLDQLLGELVRLRLPLTLDAERRTLAKDVLISYSREELLPHLHFKKTAQGLEYRLQLGVEDEKWSIRDRDVLPLTNTEPAWLLIGHALFRVPGINGNMVKPFRTKDLILIPPDKTRTYFKTFIAKAARRSRIEAEGFSVELREELLGVRLDLTENILDNSWLIKPTFLYEGAEFPPGERRNGVTTVEFPDDSAEVRVRKVLRNTSAETERLAILQALGLRPDGRYFKIGEPENAALPDLLYWLENHRESLESAGFEIAAPVADDKPLATAAGKIEWKVDAAGDWFDVHGVVRVGAFKLPFKAFIPYLRKSERYFPLPDTTWFLIPDAWFTRYTDLAQALEPTPGDHLRLRKALFTVLESAGLVEPGGQDFPVIDPESVAYAPGPELKADLRPYQMAGVKWLVGHYQHGFGACLADDMGLGKTLQTIALLLHIKKSRTSAAEPAGDNGSQVQLDLFNAYQTELKPLQALIILPASLVFNWQREIARFAPALFVYVHTGPKRLKDARAVSGYDIVLTTYHTARQDIALLQKVAWQAIVLDESQQIKNRDSEVSKVVRALQGGYRLSLSGTPIENSLADLWTQMEFINPATLGSYAEFREQFQTPIEKQQNEKARQRLFNRVKPFFLRRTKEEVAPELPPLSEQIFYTEMLPEQHKRYEQVKSAMRNQILNLFDDPKTRLQALQALMRLRQIANHPILADEAYEGGSGKYEDVLAQWDVIRRSGHKALFFSSFEKHLQLFRREFEAQGLRYAWLTGDTAQADRAREVQKFQEDDAVQAFFMTIKAGGVGLNLTAADYVFMLDPWWNPAAEDQAVARAHRIGQTRPVTAVRFIARETIEEKIRVLQERKKALGQELFAAGGEIPQLSREDLELLLL
jgi:hypothetical protein